MKKLTRCKYNEMIKCSGSSRPCDSCGWNPEVHKKRIAEIVAAMKPEQACGEMSNA